MTNIEELYIKNIYSKIDLFSLKKLKKLTMLV